MSGSANSEPTAIPAPNVRRTLHSKLDSLGCRRHSRGAIHHFRMDLYRTGLVREAIRLYLSLTSLETEARLRMLRLINESAGVSGKTAGQLVEEARREEDA